MIRHRIHGAVLALSIFAACAGVSFAYDPPAGGPLLPILPSPQALGFGLTTTTLDSPWADRLNPAASAGQQRPALDAGFVLFTDFGTSGQGIGGAGGLGLTLPEPFGVLGASLRLVATPPEMTALPLGFLVETRGSIAKDLFPNFFVGAGLDLSLGSNGDFGWGLCLDLGFEHLLGDLGFLKDFRWGGLFSGIGKGYSAPLPVTGVLATGSASSSPPPFTPSFGVRALFVRKGDWKWGFGLDISSPSFQDFGLNLSTNLTWRDLIAFRSAWGFFARELAAGSSRSLIPSFSLAASIPIETKAKESYLAKQGWNRVELKPAITAAPLYGDVWGLGAGITIPLGVLDRNPPRITVKFPAGSRVRSEKAPAPIEPAANAEPLPFYLSSNNDGTKDLVDIQLSIKDERYLVGYTMKVYRGTSASGPAIRSIANKEVRPELQGFEGLWERLTYVKKGIPVPEKLVWYGRADDGSNVPDGEYSITIEAVDDNGNVGLAGPFQVVVDTVPPSGELTSPAASLIFSPDGDGNKDQIPFAVSGSVEDLWTLQVLDASGKAVRYLEYVDGSPTNFTWDGKAEDGSVLPDGVYSIALSSTDRAGNSVAKRIDNIIVNTQQPPINVAIDLSTFSPNGDGQKDSVALIPSVPVTNGLVSWKLSVLDKGKTELWSMSGSDAKTIPERQAFAGIDNSGKALPEGQYQASLAVTYLNGHSPVTFSPYFVLDVTPPRATVKADRDAFNPAGREGQNLVVFSQAGSKEERWIGEIIGSGGTVVRSYSFGAEPEPKIDWDGADDAGKPVPDGVYSYRLKSSDRAGNSFISAPASVSLDTEEKAARISVDQRAFSPNADGQKDSIRIASQVEASDRLKSYEITVESVDAPGLAAGSAVRSWKGERALPEALVWDGLSDGRTRVPDGRYLARLMAVYVNADSAEAFTTAFVIDTKPPQAEVSAEPLLFSPNGDGRKDDLSFTQQSLPGDDWDGRIVAEADGSVVRSYSWKGQSAGFVWDGTDEAGNRVKDGSYRYETFSTDPAGNSFKTSVTGIQVDARTAQVFVTASDTGLSPNGDGFRDSVSFAPIVNLRDGIESWKFSIADKSGAERRLFGGKGGNVPARIDWDGKDDKGNVTRGEVVGIFSVEYLKGDHAEARTGNLVVDVDGPAVALRLTPEFFSPDNDGVDDELSIAISISDASDVAEWRFEIDEAAVVEGGASAEKPKDRLFIAWGGKGKPAASITWDGRSAKGELVEAAVDYPFYFSIKDSLGNVTETKGTIPVDVLVIREEDRLKIKVPSIVFRPNGSDFGGLQIEDIDRNNKVIKRIAQILNRFKDYRIGIEGHANSIAKIYGYSDEKIAEEENMELLPLSTGRAELVRKLLVENGVDPKRLSVRGLGSSFPVVDFKDAVNRWKNRRVEFILYKNQ